MRYFLELCLHSVEAALKNLDAEIIVVDNGSSDDSCCMVKALFPQVQLIENQYNYGFSKGNNIGVFRAKGEYVCILNPDTVVPEDVFTKLLDFADSKLDLGVLGCQLIDGTGEFLPESKRNIPTPLVAFNKILGNGNTYYSSMKPNQIAKVDILVGAFMLIKTSVYKAFNGFDEDYFMYGEDIDLSYRLLKEGYVNYYNGEVSIIHFKGESALKDEVYAKRFFGSMKLFYKKHFNSNFLINTLVILGIKLASVFQPEVETEAKNHQRSLVFSDQLNEDLEAQLPKPVVIISNLNILEKESLIILDAKKLSFKSIINTIKCHSKSENLAFRIWPKKSKFALGSDSANGQGDVINFD